MVAEEVGHWLEATDCHIVVTLDLLAPAVVGSLERGPLEHLVVTSLAGAWPCGAACSTASSACAATAICRLPDDARRHRFDHLLQSEPLAEPAAVDPAEDVAVLAPTGGTTASPKAVMLTHRNLVANAMQLRNWVGGADGTTSILGVLPFFHSYGLTVSLLSGWAKAARSTCTRASRRGRCWTCSRRSGPRSCPAVPAMLHALNNVMRGQEARPVVHPGRHLGRLGPAGGRARRSSRATAPATWSRATA